MVEIVGSPLSVRSQLLLQNESGAIFDEEGRAVFKMPGPVGRPIRILLDPDADLYRLALGTEPDLLRRCFEVHLPAPPSGPLPYDLRGMTLVSPCAEGARLPAYPDLHLAAAVPQGTVSAPLGSGEVHVEITDPEKLPDSWPSDGGPLLGVLPLSKPGSTDLLPELTHGMGTGKFPFRELRLRVRPQHYQLNQRRPPFLSEVVEAVATAVGCSTNQLARELALRGRMVKRGLRRHLLPDPYFVTWVFRAHQSRGLVPATRNFPIPRRGSRQEMLRGTPESEHQRLFSYLGLLEDSQPRLLALAERDLFAVSVHYLPNPDLPLFPDHGGIARWDGSSLTPLQR